MQLASVEFDLRLCDVDVAHRQGVGEGVQKGRGIVRPDVHDRVRRRLAVVEGDLHGMEQAAERSAALSELLDEVPVDDLAGFFKLARVQEPDHRIQLSFQAALILRPERGAAHRLDAEHVHDLFSAQPRTGFGPLAMPAHAGCFARLRRCGFRERVDLAFFDVQPEG